MALQIIHEAGQGLAREAIAVIHQLDFGDGPVPIAPLGGAFEHIQGLREAFSNALRDEHMSALVVDPELPPVFGAAILALELCQIEPSQVLSRLRADLHRLHAEH